ncbi:hypothetical protein M422DRAFT_264039 [Sphaerobolus stellatus SS14]|uniref:Uncharacterized protein n=1 Tax=Sphaerobolus stellatus (strain SS14) TaxID=990650 RepID=A0A0C9V9I8_SPHS4|nr:hypothetical protein M422DRAFT_264039 [Sphaerobolus stellatus SS14]
MHYTFQAIYSSHSAFTTIFSNAIRYKVAAASLVALLTNIYLTILMVLTVAWFSAPIWKAIHPGYFHLSISISLQPTSTLSKLHDSGILSDNNMFDEGVMPWRKLMSWQDGEAEESGTKDRRATVIMRTSWHCFRCNITRRSSIPILHLPSATQLAAMLTLSSINKAASVVHLTVDDDENGRDEDTGMSGSGLTWRRRVVVGGGGGRLEGKDATRRMLRTNGSKMTDHPQRTRPSPDEAAAQFNAQYRLRLHTRIPITYCITWCIMTPRTSHPHPASTSHGEGQAATLGGLHYLRLNIDVCAAQTALSTASDSSKAYPRQRQCT